MDIQNVLASRYASPRMCRIWSAENKIIAERRLWLAVMEAQRDLGVDFGGDDPDWPTSRSVTPTSRSSGAATTSPPR